MIRVLKESINANDEKFYAIYSSGSQVIGIISKNDYFILEDSNPGGDFKFGRTKTDDPNKIIKSAYRSLSNRVKRENFDSEAIYNPNGRLYNQRLILQKDDIKKFSDDYGVDVSMFDKFDYLV